MTDSLWIPPALIFFIGSVLSLVLRGRARQAVLLLVPAACFVYMAKLPEGSGSFYEYLGRELVILRVDRLSKVFGYIFVIMGFAGALFALRLRDTGQHVAAFLYAGCSLGVVFSGDFLTLFIFWEAMALASAYLIWAGRSDASKGAGLRYLLVHFAGGLSLLAGIVIRVAETGSLEFGYIGLDGLSSWLMLIGFALNAAVPPLSAWLSDAYPEASVTGAVFLSAYTSKTAVYVLARGFPGAEILIWAGTLMTIYGIVYAILENDIRRILAYSIINQVGFMVAGIGIGTELSINGAASHAFAHILYKALLMMSAGAVIQVTGRRKCTELGGLYRTMPITLSLCLVGAASISAFPLTGGFVSKSMVIAAAGQGGLTAIWLLLTLASAGVFLHAGIKFPWFVFFARDSGLRPKEPPLNMLMAMGLLAFLCLLIGIYPQVLYVILPYPVEFVPYTASHVLSQLQILLYSALAFFFLLRYLQRTNTISLDTDWFYRKGAVVFMRMVTGPVAGLSGALARTAFQRVPRVLRWFSLNPLGAMKMGADIIHMYLSGSTRRSRIRQYIDDEKSMYPGDTIKHWPSGFTVLWVTLSLLTYLLLYYFR